MVSDKTKEVILGVSICLIVLGIGAMILYPVAVSGIDGLSTGFDRQRTATLCLMLSAFVGLISYFDFPERIRRSSYLSDRAMLLAYLTSFLYLVFGFLPGISKYRLGGRLFIIGVIATLGVSSVVKVVKHASRASKGSATPTQ